jgi:hypothetical protein
MSTDKPQSFENHARIIPLYHFVTFGLFFVNLLWSSYRAFTDPTPDRIVTALLGVALILLAFYARSFALTVQDRVIRLEMSARLRDMLPADLRARANALSVRQLIALRFAGDEELPALCAKVLDENIQDQKAIKKMIRHWRPDHLRA